MQRAQQRVPQLEQELQSAIDDLQKWQSEHPSLNQTKAAMDQEWLPQKDGCMKTHNNYVNGRDEAIASSAPSYYDDSCEKACIESTAESSGCGVIEGDHADDPLTPENEDWNNNGGVEAHCQPPQPSWIMGPFTHGEKEPEGQQCGRIETYQRQRHAQSILKAGYLLKAGRIGGWYKRFFVLESGDAVRSAVLRYYKKDPAVNAKAEERHGKGIILWDAKSVKAKVYSRDSWKTKDMCFKLYHFYRKYKFCVPKMERATNRQHATDEGMVRDEWMDLISNQIDPRKSE